MCVVCRDCHGCACHEYVENNIELCDGCIGADTEAAWEAAGFSIVNPSDIDIT